MKDIMLIYETCNVTMEYGELCYHEMC